MGEKKEADGKSIGFSDLRNVIQQLGRFDIFSARTFGAAAFGVCHPLAFSKLIEGGSHNIRRMKKHVLFGSGVNKSETLVRQPLDRTFCHCNQLLKKKVFGCCPTKSVQAAPPQYMGLYHFLWAGQQDFQILAFPAGWGGADCPNFVH